MNVNEIAKAMGVTRRTVYRWDEYDPPCPYEKVDDGTLQPKRKYDFYKVKEWRKKQWSKR